MTTNERNIFTQQIHAGLDEQDVLKHALPFGNYEECILIGPCRLQLNSISGSTLEVVIVYWPEELIISNFICRKNQTTCLVSLRLFVNLRCVLVTSCTAFSLALE